jgi:alpha-glucoside transport system substrate-binding protein
MARARWLSAALLVAVLGAACGDDDDDDDAADTTPATVDAGSADTGDTGDGEGDGAAPAAPAAYAELVAAEAGEYDGTTVTFLGPWIEAEQEAFEATLAGFEERTGIDVQYEGNGDFETVLNVRVESGDAPDLAVIPQPGLLRSFVESGDVLDISGHVAPDQLAEDYSQAWLDLATVDGQLSGVFFRASTKSIVWYPVAAFEEAGYAIPTTWDELIALSDQIVADGSTPWCISIEDSGATGWVATDWLEEIVLREAGPDVYDQWVAHEIPFDDPAIAAALDTMGEIWLNEDYVYGGTTAILTTWIGDTQTPMFEAAGPDCWMHRQAGWIPDFWPEGTEPGVDSDFFYLPPIDPALGSPVLGAGDVMAAFDDRPEVWAVLEYLATPDAAAGWIEQGGFISPHNGVTLDSYANVVDQGQAEILANATTFRFDGSDLMPAEVGAGTFWSGMVEWVDGADTATVLSDIDASWPS